jgi:hypothetical protein
MAKCAVLKCKDDAVKGEYCKTHYEAVEKSKDNLNKKFSEGQDSNY